MNPRIKRKIKMKPLLRFALLAFLALALAGCSSAPPVPQVGDAAPDFTLVDRQGKTWTLSQLKGQVVFVNFWATWCPPCQQELPSMQRLFEQMPEDRFKMLAVLSNDKVDMADFMAEQKGLTFPILDDGEGLAGLAYLVTGLPETYLIDKKGVIRKKHLGADEWDSPDNLGLIRTLLEE